MKSFIVGLLAGIAIIFGIVGCGNNNSPTTTTQPTQTTTPTTQTIPTTSTTSTVAVPTSCHAIDNGALPDPKCSPGVFNNAVTQANIKQTICMRGWTSTIRPPVTYTEPLKFKLMRAYGDTDSARNYELDHIVPLELGGDPSSPQNLFPQPHHVIVNGKEEGSYVKDGLENKLNSEVCNGTMTLEAARNIMQSGAWINGG